MLEAVKYCSCGKFISRGEWMHPDRIIDTYEVILVTEGKVYINANGTEYTLEQNDILLMEPNKRHFGYKTSSDVSFFWLHWVESPKGLLEEKQCKIENSYNLSLLFRQLLEYRTSGEFPERLDYLTRLILMEILLNGTHTRKNPIAEKTAQWIRANEDILLKASEVAEYLGYNTDYLNRIFKKHYSKSLKEFIDEEKMKQIKNLMLTTNLTLSEIACRTGFSEYKYFLKFFKYHEGITPTEFYGVYSAVYTNSGGKSSDRAD